MALNEAFGQTDVIRDPNHLRIMLNSHKRSDREAAKFALEQMDHDQAQKEREGMFYYQRQQDAQQHGDAIQTRRDLFDEGVAARKDSRDAREAGLKEAHDTGRAQQLQMMVADPNLGKPAQDAAKAELIKLMGLTVAPTVGSAKGEYGPGGASKSFTPSSTSYTPPTGVFTNSEAKPVTKNGTQLNVDGGRVYGSGAPVGYDVNTNTGEFIPKGQVGTINGVNATQFLADHTIRTGIRPEESKAMALYDQTKNTQGIARGNPPPNDENPVAKPVSGYTPPTAAFAPETKATQPQAAAPVPGPNPTPGAPYVGPFSELNVTAPAVAPAPTPFIPPAVPTPSPVLNPQASNERQDLLKDTENTFYGGGNAPVPTPTPTPPQPQHLALAHKLLADYYGSLA